MSHSWPGNVRELLNVLESAILHHPFETLEDRHLNDLLDDGAIFAGPAPSSRQLEESTRRPESERAPRQRPKRSRPTSLDRQEIATVLASTGGNLARASRRLGVPRSTLRYWVGQHGLAELIPRD